LRKEGFLALAGVLMICSIIIQPVLAKRGGRFSLQGECKIEFEAEATGPFVFFRGFVGPELGPTVAVGEGMGKFDGEAAVDHVVDGIYLDFPAEMKTDGELKGVISPVVDGMVVSDETWRFELEFWNLENAGGVFWPEENGVMVATGPPPDPVLLPCLGYKLELERLDVEDDEELKISGEAYAIVAAPEITEHPYEVFIIEIDVAGTPYSIFFSEYPDLGSVIKTEVELDVD